MKLTKEQVLNDIALLPSGYKTADIDRLIKSYIRNKADSSELRPYVLEFQQLHRIFYFIALKQIDDVNERMEFIHNNLLFSDWWHTDQLIGFVSDIDFETLEKMVDTNTTMVLIQRSKGYSTRKSLSIETIEKIEKVNVLDNDSIYLVFAYTKIGSNYGYYDFIKALKIENGTLIAYPFFIGEEDETCKELGNRCPEMN